MGNTFSYSPLPLVLLRQSVPCDVTLFESVTRELREQLIIAVKGLLGIPQVAIHTFDMNTKVICLS